MNSLDKTMRMVTCIFLGQHRSIHQTLKSSHPILLLLLGLACKQELPVGRYYGDAKLPVVALGGWGKAGEHNVAVLLTTNEHLTARIGILTKKQRGEETQCVCVCVCVYGNMFSLYLWGPEVSARIVNKQKFDQLGTFS
jgi:hypothetical protein